MTIELFSLYSQIKKIDIRPSYKQELFHPNTFIHLHQLDVNIEILATYNEYPIRKQNTYIDSFISGDFDFVVLYKMYVAVNVQYFEYNRT